AFFRDVLSIPSPPSPYSHSLIPRLSHAYAPMLYDYTFNSSGFLTSGARSSSNQHAVDCVSVTFVISGICSKQTSIANGQRGANGQPFGGSDKSGGVPGMDSSLLLFLCNRGIDDNNPHV